MNFKKALVAGMMLLAFGSAASNAQAAIPLQDFNKVDPQRKAEVVSAVFQAYYNQLSQNESTKSKAQCMVALNEPKTGPSLSKITRVALDIASEDKAGNHTVESVIGDVIERECGSTGIAKTNPVRPGSPG
ncbi:MAG: hypothetical protein CO093_08875 [Alphaproteobacteria bacterium CG_4_9_14_3_um_filter_47_13]|nr:MAG: hypothetical protein CO093_08875 [Alphaproteobacteria bacterium CG_4_9_14_3_um_filter_47_13]